MLRPTTYRTQVRERTYQLFLFDDYEAENRRLKAEVRRLKQEIEELREMNQYLREEIKKARKMV